MLTTALSRTNWTVYSSTTIYSFFWTCEPSYRCGRQGRIKMPVAALESSRSMKALISPCLLLMISSDMINYLLWQIGAYWDIMKNIEAYWNILKELVRLSIHRRVCAAHGGQPSSRERAAAGGPAGRVPGCYICYNFLTSLLLSLQLCYNINTSFFTTLLHHCNNIVTATVTSLL